MKSFMMKKMSVRLATVAVLGALASPVMAASAVEYGLIQSLIGALGTLPGATEHNQCNQQPVKKSPVNNKSLNPVCNICIGGEDAVAGKYVVVTANSGAVGLICINATIGGELEQLVPFPAQKITDLQAMCDSRGGTFVDYLNVGLITICSFPAP